MAASPDEPSPGVQLPPQKSADTGKVTGTFPDGTHAILLVYRTGADADARGKSKPLAVQLRDGRNELAVGADDSGRLLVYDPVFGEAASPITREP